MQGTVQDILPLEVYQRHQRPPLLLFVVPAVAIGLFLQTCQQLSPDNVARGLASGDPADAAVQILLGGAVGAGAAVYFWIMVWLGNRWFMKVTYRGKWGRETPMPEDTFWTHRLVAGLEHGWWHGVQGALFACRGRLVFVPQALFDAHQKGVLWIEVDKSLTFTVGEKAFGSLTPVFRLVGIRPGTKLVIRSRHGEWSFVVPDPETAAEGLRQVVRPGF